MALMIFCLNNKVEKEKKIYFIFFLFDFSIVVCISIRDDEEEEIGIDRDIFISRRYCDSYYHHQTIIKKQRK